MSRPKNKHDPKSVIRRHVGGILSGKITSNHWIRRSAERWQRDLKRRDIWMDWDLVTRCIEWIEGLRLVAGHAGQQWTLLPWQQWVIASAIGWHWRKSGLPRTRELLLQVARKNGKTTLMAGLALWELIGRAKQGRSVNVVANKADQAKILLNYARDMARPLLPAKDSRGRTTVQHASICCDFGEMTAQTHSEKSMDGLNPSLWIGDEVAEWKGMFIDKMRTATIGRDDGLGVLITTPGNNPDLVYPRLVSECEQMLEQVVTIDNRQAFIYGVDDEDDIADERCWLKANPSLGAALRLEVLQQQWQSLQLTPLGRIAFTRFHLARPVEHSGRWLEMDHWDSIAEPAELPEGSEVWLGVDTSKTQDMSAVVMARPTAAGVVHLAGRYWYPSESAKKNEVTHAMPFRRWASEGRLTLSPGREIDYDAIMDEIVRLAGIYRVRQIAVDPWNTALFNKRLLAKNLPVVEHRQGIAMMGPASQEWQNLWVGRRLRHGNDPILRAACANAVCKTDDVGNIRPVKVHSRGLIDPLIAAIMAVHSWALSQGTAPSMYEAGVGVG